MTTNPDLIPLPDWRVYVVSPARERVAEIDDWLGLSFVQRFNDVGSFALDLRADAQTEAVLGKLLSPGYGVEFVRNGQRLLSGQPDDYHWTWNGDENTLELTGPDDNVWLQRRLCLPTPLGPPYVDKYDVRNGPFETTAKSFVDANLGPSAKSARKVPGLSVEPDGGAGPFVQGKGRFGTVLEMLQLLAGRAGNAFGFRVAPVANGIEFQVYEVQDRSDRTRLQPERQNVASVEYEQQGSQGNYVVVGGAGSGTSRTFVEGGDSQSIVKWGRVEVFVDDGSEDDPDALQTSVSDTLTESAEVTTITPEARDDLSVAYGRDYVVGDIVAATIGAVDVSMTVQEIEVDVAPDQAETVKPTLGTPGSSPTVARVFGAGWGKRFASRISALETGR